MAVVADGPILGHKAEAVLDGGGVDQPIGGIARKGRRQPGGRVRDCRGDAERAQLCSQAVKPRPDRNGDGDALMLCQPRQLVPRDRCQGKFVRGFQRLLCRSADGICFVDICPVRPTLGCVDSGGDGERG